MPDHDFRLHPPDARLLEGRPVLDDPKLRRKVEAEIPLGRWGEIADIARAVAWVASAQARYIVGTTLFVDGGMTLYPNFV